MLLYITAVLLPYTEELSELFISSTRLSNPLCTFPISDLASGIIKKNKKIGADFS